MKTAKMLMGVAALAASALVLSACAGSDTSGSGDTAAAHSISLRMTTWTADKTQLALFNSIADSYKKSHPEIKKITFDSLPFEDYTTTLTTQIAGGDAPDLAWVLEQDAPDFVSSGALAPLTDALKATKGYDYGDIKTDTTKLWVQNSKLYAYPFSTSPFVVFANDDLLKQAGLPTSAELKASGKWNWKDLADIGSKVNAATGKTGMIIRDFDFTGWSNLSTIWDSFDAAPWSKDGKTCTFDSAKMTDAFTYIHDAIFSQKAMPGPGTKPDFFAGDSAFTVTQISRASLLAGGSITWNVLPLPDGPDGHVSVVGQAGLGVMAKGKHAEEATKFLAYFTNPTNSKLLAQFFPPPRTSQLNAKTLAATNKLLSEDQIKSVVIDAFDGAVTKPSHTNSAEIAAKVKTALDPMWKADANVKSVLGGVCSAIKPMLAG